MRLFLRPNIFSSLSSPTFRPLLSNGPALLTIRQVRHGGSGRPPKSEFENRAVQVLKGFDKVDTEKDLGLDSLDTVEVLMAIEDEFLIEIPDEVADEIHNLREAIDYVYDRWTPENYM